MDHLSFTASASIFDARSCRKTVQFLLSQSNLCTGCIETRMYIAYHSWPSHVGVIQHSNHPAHQNPKEGQDIKLADYLFHSFFTILLSKACAIATMPGLRGPGQKLPSKGIPQQRRKDDAWHPASGRSKAGKVH